MEVESSNIVGTHKCEPLPLLDRRGGCGEAADGVVVQDRKSENFKMKILLTTLFLSVAIATSQTVPPTPLVKENATQKLSEHVYVIPDGNIGGVPNVGIIVGSKAVLVVDTGLGPRNGDTVLREVRKLSAGEINIVGTHFHSEHILGESAFPASAHIIRARAEQKDIDEF